jgi:hypothetical protein
MKKLTPQERRRMFLAQQAAQRAMLERVNAPPRAIAAVAPGTTRNRLLTTAIIATLIGCGLLASQVMEFTPPTSIEALLPRM